jgi:hypothetical protein
MVDSIYDFFAHLTALGRGCVTSSALVATTAQAIAGGMSKLRAWDGQEQKE